MATTQFSITCAQNFSHLLNVTGASIQTVKNFGPLPPWCQNAVCGARLASKTMTPYDKLYPFYSFGDPYNFIWTWTEFWAWTVFILEVFMGVFQCIEIYKIDQVDKMAMAQSVNGKIRNTTEYHKNVTRARGAGMWATRWVAGGLYIAMAIAMFIWFLASNQYSRPGAIVFQTGNLILSTQMLIPVLLLANGVMSFWSSFIYHFNYAELLHAKIIVPMLIVINIVIIGFIEIMYTQTLELDSIRTQVTWGGNLFIISALPFLFTMVHSKLGWADEKGTAEYAAERSWSDFRHIRLALAVMWGVAAILIACQVPSYLNCSLLNVNDKVIDTMVYVGSIAIWATILILLYFIYFIVTFSSQLKKAEDLNKNMTCCELTTDLCCSFESSTDTAFSATWSRQAQDSLMTSKIPDRSSIANL